MHHSNGFTMLLLVLVCYLMPSSTNPVDMNTEAKMAAMTLYSVITEF